MLLQLPQFIVEACPIVVGLFVERKPESEHLIVPKTHHPQRLNECEQRKGNNGWQLNIGLRLEVSDRWCVQRQQWCVGIGYDACRLCG